MQAFGADVDYAQLVKLYGPTPEGQRRYSPAECVGARKADVTGKPEKDHISTSYVERQNLTMRMHVRRFTQLTNGFSKKVENNGHMVALYTRLVQLRSHPQDAAGDARDSGRGHRPAVEHGRGRGAD